MYFKGDYAITNGAGVGENCGMHVCVIAQKGMWSITGENYIKKKWTQLTLYLDHSAVTILGPVDKNDQYLEFKNAVKGAKAGEVAKTMISHDGKRKFNVVIIIWL